jgi:hypothetical protein
MDRPRTTDPGIVKGKVAYLAPELLENAKPDARCDRFQRATAMIDALSALLHRHAEPANGTSIARGVRHAKSISQRSVSPGS